MQKTPADLMSPREVSKALRVGQPTIRRWVRDGLLKPALITMGGHARYDRALIEGFRKGGAAGADDQVTEARHTARIEDVDAAATGDALRYKSLRISPEIEHATVRAKRGAEAVARLAVLQDAAVLELLGITRGQLFSQVWQHQLGAVAARLGIAPGRLREICDMYAIPTPGAGYWGTAPERRGVRILDRWSSILPTVG